LNVEEQDALVAAEKKGGEKRKRRQPRACQRRKAVLG